MASIILGTAILTIIHFKDKKDKKKEEARKAVAAHAALVEGQQRALDGIYRGNNFANASVEALPAYTPAPKRRTSSVYSREGLVSPSQKQ